jgi:UDP-N-acetylmuramate--alanine ligase
MLADILLDVGKSPTAIVGSIVREFGSNFLGGSPQGPFVVEACEYKDHILKLSPDILVITNLEWDHTDWFPSLEAMQATFKKVVEKVPETGVIIANLSDANVAPVLKVARAKIVDYAIESAPELQMIGEFNKMNARAAKAAAKAIAPELTDGVIDVILESFQGTWRRFQYKGETPEGAFVFDDYAHHPTAIRETLKAAYDAMLSGRKLIVAFHPHLYSRTRDLMEEFAGAFEGADEVVLAPIYAARENPIPGITSEELARRIEKHGVVAKAFSSLGEVEKYLRTVSNFKTNIITMGAGDIYKVADALVSTQKK